MADIYPPEMDTPLGQLRALISDTEQYVWTPGEAASYRTSDSVLNGFLGLGGGKKVYGAAALALRAMAANEILIGKYIKTEDLMTDGAKVGDALRLLAREYENKQKEDDDNEAMAEFGFEVVTYPYPYVNMEW